MIKELNMKKIKFRISKDEDQLRLDQALARHLPVLLDMPFSKSKVRKLIVAGAVYINRRRVRIASKPVFANAEIEIYIDFEKLGSNTAPLVPFEMTADRILFEDDYLIVVNKPPGLPTQPTLDEARDNLFNSVKKFLANRSGQSVSQVYLGLHHRLDRDTSGVILLTKSKEANPGIAKAFASHSVQKVYQALCFYRGKSTSKELPKTWSIKNYLGRSKETSGKTSKFCSVKSGGDLAVTEFKIIKQKENILWVEARPLTGRTHQIRVHLSENQMPILGDPLYGGPEHLCEISFGRVMLHASCLMLEHPTSGKPLMIEAPLPVDYETVVGKIHFVN